MPPPIVQAQSLLEWLQARYGGQLLRASDVECIGYPEMLEQKNWGGQPWVGRHGVGKCLTRLTGGKKRYDYWRDENGYTDRFRTYLIPIAVTTRKRRRAAGRVSQR